MRSIDEALRVILEAVAPLDLERVPLRLARGRVLARDVLARHDAPPFDVGVMDGWAVRASCLEGVLPGAPRHLRRGGESRAGGPPPPTCEAGEAVRIFTGAVLPPRADAVVMQEDAVEGPDGVAFHHAPAVGSHVRRRGQDLREGARVLGAGTLLGPGEVAALAAQGVAEVESFRRPRVAVLSTGDELWEGEGPPPAGRILDANGPALAAAIEDAGCEAVVLRRAPDALAPLTASVRDGLRADALVISGGVSVGDHDLVHLALRDAGVRAEFWKVDLKPGKPLTFGTADRTPVFGLPGNPVSAWVTFEVFVRPALRRMLGHPDPHRAFVEVTLAAPATHATGRTELARARLDWSTGAPRATLLAQQGSGQLTSLLDVDALVRLPADRAAFEVGETLPALVLRPAHASSVSFDRASFDRACLDPAAPQRPRP